MIEFLDENRIAFPEIDPLLLDSFGLYFPLVIELAAWNTTSRDVIANIRSRHWPQCPNTRFATTL